MIAVSVVPSLAACCFACRSSSSLIRIVVLMHQNILLRHKYVNRSSDCLGLIGSECIKNNHSEPITPKLPDTLGIDHVSTSRLELLEGFMVHQQHKHIRLSQCVIQVHQVKICINTVNIGLHSNDVEIIVCR